MGQTRRLPSLKARIIRLTTGTTLVTAVILCVAGVFILRDALGKVALQVLRPELSVYAHDITDHVVELRSFVAVMGGGMVINEAVQQLNRDAAFVELPAQDLARQRVARQRVERSFEHKLETTPYLRQAILIADDPEFRELARVGVARGEVSRAPPDELRSLKDAPFLGSVAAIAPGTSRLTPLMPEPTLRGGRDVFWIVYAIPDRYGSTVAYLALMVDYERLMNALVRSLPRGVELHIAAPDGASMKFSAFASRPVVHRMHREPGLDAYLAENFVSVQEDVSFDEDLSVTVTLFKSRAIVMEKANRQMRWTLFLAVVLTLVAALFATVSGGLLARNLSRLADAVSAPREDMERARFVGGGFREAQVLAERFQTVFNQLVDKTREASWNATNDALSGLLNRHGLEIAQAKQLEDGDSLTVFCLDLDRFKLVNDTLGHEAGDAVIAAVGDRLRNLCASTDLVARMGGDEFNVLKRNISSKEAEAFAQDAIRDLARPVWFEGKECRFGVSMGLASGTFDQLKDSELYKRADQALYMAKGQGRGRYCVFSSALERRVMDRSIIASELERAIENADLVVEYLPKVAADTLRPIGVEALVRWDHAERGRLLPATFLPIAEDLKLSHLIDEAVLRQVLVDQRRWQEDYGLDLNVSVNVSSRRLMDPQLVSSMRGLQITPGTISFELLESIFLDDVREATIWTCDALREMGLGLEIDDFGTGHASLLSVTRIRPDWIKIDEALISNVGKAAIDNELVHAIVRMAQPFGASVMAEGVRSLEQAELLADLGCKGLQGEFMSMPMASAAIPDWTFGQLAKSDGLKKSTGKP